VSGVSRPGEGCDARTEVATSVGTSGVRLRVAVGIRRLLICDGVFRGDGPAGWATIDGFELGYTTEVGVECQGRPARNGG